MSSMKILDTKQDPFLVNYIHGGFEIAFNRFMRLDLDELIEDKPSVEQSHLDMRFWEVNPLLWKDIDMFDGASLRLWPNKKRVLGETPSNVLYDTYTKTPGKYLISNPDLVAEYLGLITTGKVCWYDFEGFSLPFDTEHDGFTLKMYNQIAFQVCTIVDDNVEHYVMDPANITKQDIISIVKTVYADKADRYIVYNKAYENTRLKEFAAQVPEVKEMVDWIIENTVDLYNLFRVSTSASLPPILLLDRKGNASIKDIEKHIHANDYALEFDIKAYSSLAIQNGSSAMSKAIMRYLDVVPGWDDTDLKLYCENDVNAMILIREFIKKITL